MLTSPVLTYKDGSDVSGKLLELGASDVLSMPLTPDIVRNRVSNVSNSKSTFTLPIY